MDIEFFFLLIRLNNCNNNILIGYDIVGKMYIINVLS